MSYTLRRLLKMAVIASCGLLFLLLAVFLPTAPVRAQYTGIATVGPLAFTLSTCDAMDHTFAIPNLAQTVHFVVATEAGNPTWTHIYIAESSGNQISDTLTVGSTGTQGGIITAKGYYSQVFIHASCSGGSSPVISMTYTGTSSNDVPLSGIQDQNSWLKYVAQAAPENVTTNFGSFLAPYGNSCGQLFFAPNQGSNSGTLTVASNGLTGQTIATYTIPAAFQTSVFNIPCQPAQGIIVTYTVVSGNAGTFALYYAFYKPGLFPNLTSPNSGTSSTLPIQVISDELGSAFAVSGTVSDAASQLAPLVVFNNSGSKSVYFDKLYITTTANATFQIYGTTNTGTCGGPYLVAPLRITNSTVGTVTSGGQNCTVNPTGGINDVSLNVFVPANTTVVVDLRGWILPAGLADGLSFVPTANITATVTAAVQWYEK